MRVFLPMRSGLYITLEASLALPRLISSGVLEKVHSGPTAIQRRKNPELPTDEKLAEFIASQRYADPMSVERLAACGPGTLGESLRRFIVDNGLKEKLATNYRSFHEALEAGGMLDNMPQPLRYAVLRGFQCGRAARRGPA